MRKFPEIPKITRPDPELVARVKAIGAANAAAALGHMGIPRVHICGPVARTKGKVMAGPAVTLQCMPRREDMFDTDEYGQVEVQLHRHVLYEVESGDVVVVDARGDLTSGIFGDMMMTYFKGKGGAGVVVDGAIRDWAAVEALDIPMWLTGVTPNYHAQTNLMPFAVNVTVACGGVTVNPGDIIVGDDDGVVCVPPDLAEAVIERSNRRHEWENFSRERLLEGGSLKRYYPLHDDARGEFEDWKKANPDKV